MPETTLAALFADFPLLILNGLPDSTIIQGIQPDSRQITTGDLFIATKGHQFDSHVFIPDALRRGAAAVVGTEPDISSGSSEFGVPYIQVENSRQALAYLAAAYFEYPAKELTVIGVTGTDGKTTTCNLLYNILTFAGIQTGMISTVNAIIGDKVLDTGYHVTTPDAVDLQRYLRMMVTEGLSHVVLETTSHGLAQHRVDACEFDVGILTNITHEHLDEHGSFDIYVEAKGRLFESLSKTGLKPQGNPRLAVFNADDESYRIFREKIPTRQITYGLNLGAQIRAKDIRFNPDGLRFNAVSKDWQVPVNSNLVGTFNVSNCLAALTASAYGLGIEPHLASQGISKLAGIPGRMELIDLGQDFFAMVDFAHTPNALRNAIETAREITKGKVIVIFGSAGLRDPGKRQMMAEISGDVADLTILTAEDPRTEVLDDILSEMAAGIEYVGGIEGETYWCVPDRGKAIKFGLGLASRGDVVLACGKGHEQSMCFGEIEYPWDDRIAMKAALSDAMGIDGPEMPYLPTQSP
jgi:UDP-N-acetylmuramoyl-L-alanyl-D-glutamate--2,6-diaminopimelate ligase